MFISEFLDFRKQNYYWIELFFVVIFFLCHTKKTGKTREKRKSKKLFLEKNEQKKMALKLIGGICLVLCCATAVIYAEDQTGPGDNSSSASPGLRSMIRIYDECQRTEGGVAMCLKKKAVTFIDRIAKIDVINIGDGVRVVGVIDGSGGSTKASKSISENDLDKILPRALDDRDHYLNNMLTEKLADYISGRKIQISLPQVTSSDIGRGLEEGE